MLKYTERKKKKEHAGSFFFFFHVGMSDFLAAT